MAKILSTPTNITVADLAYTTPSSKTAILIGNNTAASVRPSPHGSDEWSYATMENYGSGTFVRDFSSVGAFVVAGCGGHQGAAIFGGLVFDFENAMWSYLHNANGMPNQVWSLNRSQENSLGEIAISGVTGNMPAPAHVYRYVLGQSASDGGGPKGSLLMTVGDYVDEAAMLSLNYAYRFDLSSRLWSRVTTNTRTAAYNGYGYFVEGSAAYDPTTRRVYVTPAELSGLAALPYIDLADKTWKSTSMGGSSPSDHQQSTFVDNTRRLLVLKGSGGYLYAINLNNVSAGPVTLSLSGSLPSHNNRWDYYPVDGCWYTYAGDGSQVIHKLAPPPVSAGTSGTWTCSTVQIGGAALSPKASASGNKDHYTRFFYVPGLQCFAWVAGVTQKVALIKP
jgi:hypothetical protein